MPDVASAVERGVARHVVLVGAMGSGKTTIGAALAAALHRRFVDNDALLLDRTGMTATDLASRDGVDALHHAEAEVVLDSVRAPAASVIAAAASTIVDPVVRRALQQDVFVVWLRATPAVLAARLPQSATRPFSTENPGHLVAQQSRERDPLFAQVADLAVASDDATPDEVVAQILDKLAKSTEPNG